MISSQESPNWLTASCFPIHRLYSPNTEICRHHIPCPMLTTTRTFVRQSSTTFRGHQANSAPLCPSSSMPIMPVLGGWNMRPQASGNLCTFDHRAQRCALGLQSQHTRSEAAHHVSPQASPVFEGARRPEASACQSDHRK